MLQKGLSLLIIGSMFYLFLAPRSFNGSTIYGGHCDLEQYCNGTSNEPCQPTVACATNKCTQCYGYGGPGMCQSIGNTCPAVMGVDCFCYRVPNTNMFIACRCFGGSN